jgi:hypothetical protein
LLTACCRLVTTTGNKQCEDNLLTACEQICNNLFADLQQLVRFYVCKDKRLSFYSNFTQKLSGKKHNYNLNRDDGAYLPEEYMHHISLAGDVIPWVFKKPRLQL